MVDHVKNCVTADKRTSLKEVVEVAVAALVSYISVGNKKSIKELQFITEVKTIKLRNHVKILLQRSFLNQVVNALEEAGIIEVNKTPNSAQKSPHRIVSSKWNHQVESVFEKKNLYKTYSAIMKIKKHNSILFENLFDGDVVISAYLEDIADNFENDNSKTLFQSFVQEMFHNTFLTRKTLPDRFATDCIENAADFFAQIRLSNRSKIRDVRKDFLEDDIVSRITRYWKFNDGVVAQETQMISSGILAREAVVPILGSTNEGSYPASYKTLTTFINKFNQKYFG